MLETKNIIWWGFFFSFSNVLSTFTTARAIDDLWSISLEVNILSHLAKSRWYHFPCVWFFYWKCSTFKKNNAFSSSFNKSLSVFKSKYFFCLPRFCDFVEALNLSISFFNFLCSSSPSSRFYYFKLVTKKIFYPFSFYLFYKLNHLHLLFFSISVFLIISSLGSSVKKFFEKKFISDFWSVSKICFPTLFLIIFICFPSSSSTLFF